MACTFCADAEFRQWIGAFDEAEAKQMILTQCCVDSRLKLDSNQEASRIFLNEFRNPFLAWRDARRAA